MIPARRLCSVVSCRSSVLSSSLPSCSRVNVCVYFQRITKRSVLLSLSSPLPSPRPSPLPSPLRSLLLSPLPPLPLPLSPSTRVLS